MSLNTENRFITLRNFYV